MLVSNMAEKDNMTLGQNIKKFDYCVSVIPTTSDLNLLQEYPIDHALRFTGATDDAYKVSVRVMDIPLF